MVLSAGITSTAELVNLIGNFGVAAVMLVIFVVYVLGKAKNDDKRVADTQKDAMESVTAAYQDRKSVV